MTSNCSPSCLSAFRTSKASPSAPLKIVVYPVQSGIFFGHFQGKTGSINRHDLFCPKNCRLDSKTAHIAKYIKNAFALHKWFQYGPVWTLIKKPARFLAVVEWGQHPDTVFPQFDLAGGLAVCCLDILRQAFQLPHTAVVAEEDGFGTQQRL